jgi:imidazolonepropionase-like amidohydrolase
VAGHGGPGRSLLITNARVLDGTGAAPRGLRAIRVEDGRIAEIADDPTGGAAATGQTAASGTRVLDADGATVMPGLIDTHVHLATVPGSAYRKDNDEVLHKLQLQHLRGYLACGVTAVLESAVSEPTLRMFHEHLASGGVGPRVYALAPTFYPPNGYGSKGLFAPLCGPANSRDDVESLFEEYADLDEHIVGAKMLLESGLGAVPWPIHSPAMRGIIAEEAAKRNLPVYAHATKTSDQKNALDMGVHSLCHPGFIYYGSPSKDLIGRLRERGTYVSTTVAGIWDHMRVAYKPELLDDELVRLTVPQEELTTAADPAAFEHMFVAILAAMWPKWTPPRLLKTFSRIGYTEQTFSSCVTTQCKAILKLHDAGIPVALGTDSGCYPLFVSSFHGPSTIREIELLGQAGMAPMDVLQSATRIPAEMMGIGGLVGTVEVGKRADLIAVGEDPLEDLSALRRSIRWTIRDGEARTPREWMQ